MILSILNHFHKVHDHKLPFFAFFGLIKCNMAINPISGGQNENLRPLLNTNRGIVTIDMWSQN